MGFNFRKTILAASCLGLLGLAGTATAGNPGGHFSGRVLYRGGKTAAPGVLVEAVEARDSGQPTDEVLGSTRADAEGRFALILTKSTGGRIALVVSAVRSSAKTDGDRRDEGFEVKTRRTQLGFLSDPSPAKPNTILLERRARQQSAGSDD